MRLTSRQAKIISAVQLRGDLTTLEVAKSTRLSQRVVQYSLRRLTGEGVIQPFVLVNPHALGLTDYCLFLKPFGHHAALVDRAAAVFQKTTSVAFATQLVGEFLFSVSCFGRDVRVVEALMGQLRRALPSVSWDTRFALRIEWTLFQRKYLSGGTPARSLSRTIEAPLQSRSLKELRFLSLLTSRPTDPLSRVSLAAGISEATGRAWEREMREAGLIIGRLYHVYAQAVGRISYRIIISVNYRSPAVDRLFRDYGLHSEEITEFVICMGSWDYEFNVEVRDATDLSRHVSALYDTFREHIRQIQTMGDARILKMHQFGECEVA